MRDIKARTFNNCHGCEHDCPGQSDHIPGCLSEWGEMVGRYFTEAVLSFSRPLFAELYAGDYTCVKALGMISSVFYKSQMISDINVIIIFVSANSLMQ